MEVPKQAKVFVSAFVTYVIEVTAEPLAILIGAFCGFCQPQPDEIWHLVVWIGHTHLYLTVITRHLCTFFYIKQPLPVAQY